MDQENENKTSDLSLSLSLSMINPSNNIYKEKCFDRGKSKEEREEEKDDDEEECNISKKKLRLTEGQYNVLERSFKKHATLNPKQKEFLARELNLQPRQVEVWFQNRRARTRFKQTEKNFELMRRYYEELIKENKRMEKELQELKAFKSHKAPTVYMQQPEATLKMCPSCKRIFTTEVKPNRELIGSGSELKPDHDPRGEGGSG